MIVAQDCPVRRASAVPAWTEDTDDYYTSVASGPIEVPETLTAALPQIPRESWVRVTSFVVGVAIGFVSGFLIDYVVEVAPLVLGW